MKISMLIGSVIAVPYNGQFNATQQLEDAQINPNAFLGGARNNRTPDYIGARLQNTWDQMGTLYNVSLRIFNPHTPVTFIPSIALIAIKGP